MRVRFSYSPGLGAGWSTWNSGEIAKYMLDYQPIIEALECGEKIFDNRHTDYMTGEKTGDVHPALIHLAKVFLEKFRRRNYDLSLLGAGHSKSPNGISDRVRLTNTTGRSHYLQEVQKVWDNMSRTVAGIRKGEKCNMPQIYYKRYCSRSC